MSLPHVAHKPNCVHPTRPQPAGMALGVVLVCQTALWAFGCGSCDEERDDETLIRELIEKGAQLASQRKIKDLLALTTRDFTASPGNRKRKDVTGVLFVAFQKYQKFTVRFPRPSIEVDPSGKKAEASTPFVIVRDEKQVPDLSDLYDDPQQWITEVSEIADLYNIELSLRKEDGQWLVRKARLRGYRRLGDL